MIVEIVILAMIAAFLGLRLYSVLGQRAEHEEESIPHRFGAGDEDRARAAAPKPAAQTVVQIAPQNRLDGLVPAVERGVREIAAADPRFDITAFLAGAKGAYEMVLEAFWNGDRETLKELCDGDVYAGFSGAIDAREAAGQTLDNKLIRIEDTRIHSAVLDGRMARVAVLFVSDIAAVTRDKEGNVIAGSLDDAVESRDVWTFSRDVTSAAPDWLLDETDEG
ncbi:MAG: preprotein translocase subunit Tim44 [Sphingomonadales bacterium BRH_c3]|nr:MAG: preprotein translocase subunit Tim44 [Sphingomonadales bacterium BRH_c3]